MSELPIRPEAVRAMAVRVAELEDVPDEFVAEVLEREGWEEFVAREAAIAFCETEGLTVDDDDGHNECYRLVSTWKEKP